METIITSLQSTPYECNNGIASQICDLVITEEEVALHFRKLKNNKAAGIDGTSAEKLITPFCAIFNYIFDKGEYPTQWSEGLINVLHKKGT